MKRHARIFLGFLLVGSLLSPQPSFARPIVVLDAAHGGTDPGGQAGGNQEKDWNLKFAQSLEQAFQSAGYEVVMIRSRDQAVAFEKRVEASNTSKAVVTLVVHVDREWTGTQKGPLLVVEPPNRNESADGTDIPKWGGLSMAQYRTNLRLARALARELGCNPSFSNLSDSRGLLGENTSADGRVLCAPHQGLRYLTLPSVVVVPMFLTSSSDLKKFGQESFIRDFSEKVVQGVRNFL